MSATLSKWETRFVETDSRTEISTDKRIRGYPVVFHSRSHRLSTPMGQFREIVNPSAVDRTLRQGTDVRAFINHDSGRVLGRLRAGTLSLTKDSHGLRSEISPPTTTYAKDLMISIKRGDIGGMSFRFRVIGADGDEWRMEDGEVIRELHDIEISEVSVVTDPAYPSTEVAVRSMQAWQETIKPDYRPSMDMMARYLRTL